jgi:hypothetical protein
MLEMIVQNADLFRSDLAVLANQFNLSTWSILTPIFPSINNIVEAASVASEVRILISQV